MNRFAAHGIVAYLRYFDDCFYIFKSVQPMRDFVRYLKCISDVFQYKVVQISSTKVSNLDLTIEVIDSNIVIYPTLEKIPWPLSAHSAHVKHVHSAWPSAVRHRLFTLCDDGKLEACKAKLVSLYDSAGADHSVLAKLRADPPRRLQRDGMAGSNMISCVLRYHPIFVAAFRKAMRLVPLPSSIPFTIRPSWRNALPSMNNLVAKHNDAKGRGTFVREGASLLSSSAPHSHLNVKSTFEIANSLSFANL